MIHLKSDSEIDAMKKAGSLAGEILDMIAPFVIPGVSTQELNDIIHTYTIERGATSAPLGYMGFPKSCCISINEVVCHGIPSTKVKLKDGDIVNIDVTPIIDKWHGDTSRMYLVGNVSPEAQRLVRITKECLDLGIAAVKPGARIGDIGAAIQTHAEANGYSIVRDFVGHGIGTTFHEELHIPHYGRAGFGTRLEPGMTFTIEPMLNIGKLEVKTLKDDWTAVTVDGSWSAQFEHTIAIRSDWTVEILTLPPQKDQEV